MPTKSAALLRPKRRSLFSRKKSGALAEVDALFSSAATATHAAIVVGLVRRMSSGAFNSSRFYSPDGKLEANYDKHHLVPAWDFNVDRWLHARMAVLRAVENGFALARSARNGLLTLTDNRGCILAEAATVPGRFVSITGKVNVTPAATFYARTGDWFAWLCVAMFLVLLASRF